MRTGGKKNSSGQCVRFKLQSESESVAKVMLALGALQLMALESVGPLLQPAVQYRAHNNPAR